MLFNNEVFRLRFLAYYEAYVFFVNPHYLLTAMIEVVGIIDYVNGSNSYD